MSVTSNRIRWHRDRPLLRHLPSRAPTLCLLTLGLLSIVLAAGATVANAVQITEFPLESGSKPNYITTGPDGNLWFTDAGLNKIGRITTSGQVTEFGLGITASAGLVGIAGGPEGNIWFTERTGHRLGRITPQGVITEISSGLNGKPDIYDITLGPGGNMWFTEANRPVIGTINPATGQITEYPGVEGVATKITLGPEGNLWYVVADKAKIVRITPLGSFEPFPLASGSAYPESIAVGADGNLWFNENHGNAIGRITPNGNITYYTVGLSSAAGVTDLTAGPDGNVWFTEEAADQIGRITPQGTISEFYSGLTPGARPFGIALGPDQNLWVTERDGEIARIIPDVPPIVTTAGASSLSSNGASVSGTVRSRGADTHYDFEYGTTAAYGASTAAADNGAGDNTQAASVALAGLAPATTYHYRLAASNANGASYGSDQTFTTQPAPPPPPRVTVRPFQMYFSGYRSGRRHLRLTQIVALEATPGDRVSYVCRRCRGLSARAIKIASTTKVTFHTRDLVVSGQASLQVTVMRPDGSRRVRTYGFLIGAAEAKLDSQRCFLPRGRVAVTCPGSPPAKPKHKPSSKRHKPSAKHRRPRGKHRKGASLRWLPTSLRVELR